MTFLWILPSAVMAIWWGLSSGSWQFALMSLASMAVSLAAQRLRSGRREDQDAAMAQYVTTWQAGRWIIGRRTLPRWPALWRPRERRRVYAELRAIALANAARLALEQRSEQGFAAQSAEQPAAWLGQNDTAEDLELSLARDGPHALLVGPTGAGKSRLLLLMITSIANGSRVSWRLFDFKGGATLGGFAKGIEVGLATDLDVPAAEVACSELADLLEARERILVGAQAADFGEFNRIRKTRRALEPIVVVVDEFGALLKALPGAIGVFDSVAARGRSLGVFLLATNQTTSGLPRTLVANFRQRIALAGVDPVDAVQLGFGTAPAFGGRREGWGSAAVHDSSTRSSRAFGFPFGFDSS